MANLHLSPCGAILNDDGGCRLIHHLSYPAQKVSMISVKYTSFDNVLDMIALLGPGALLAKRDVTSAFSLLPVFPGDFGLLGFKSLLNFYTGWFNTNRVKTI